MDSVYVVAVRREDGNLEQQGMSGEDVTPVGLDAARAWVRSLRSMGLPAVAINVDSGIGCAGEPSLVFKGDLSTRLRFA